MTMIDDMTVLVFRVLESDWGFRRSRTHTPERKLNGAQILRDELETALRELSGYDPARFEQANEKYLASIGAGKPEAATGPKITE